MTKNKTEIVVRQKEELVGKSMSTVQRLVTVCPNPTQEELRKLLAIQGTILNQVGLDLLLDARDRVGRTHKQIALALKALAASKEALVASSRINSDSEAEVDADE